MSLYLTPSTYHNTRNSSLAGSRGARQLALIAQCLYSLLRPLRPYPPHPSLQPSFVHLSSRWPPRKHATTFSDEHQVSRISVARLFFVSAGTSVVGHINVNGLFPSHLTLLEAIVAESPFDAIAISETKINPVANDSHLVLDGFNFFTLIEREWAVVASAFTSVTPSVPKS